MHKEAKRQSRLEPNPGQDHHHKTVDEIEEKKKVNHERIMPRLGGNYIYGGQEGCRQKEPGCGQNTFYAPQLAGRGRRLKPG